MERVHATCVALMGQAVLLRGEPGSGKSDLALRLIDAGWDLVSDDYTELSATDGQLCASPPESIQGLLEVRGLGIVRIGCVPRAHVKALFDLRPLTEIERLPEPTYEVIDGFEVPCYALHSFDASAPAKIRMALKAQAENLFHVS